ncbi:MAG TPA: hypothetical protein VFF73_14095 [Planctomycetota bacterium]|nr:hypothetical protein [Planctomycetota bacterium]
MTRKNSNRSRSPKSIKARLVALAKGLRTSLKPTDVLDLGGNLTPAPQAASGCDQRLQVFTDTDDAKGAWKEQLQAREAATPETLAWIEMLEAALKAKLKARNVALENFGVTPKTSTERSAADKAASAAKATVTRGKKKAEQQPPTTPPAAK